MTAEREKQPDNPVTIDVEPQPTLVDRFLSSGLRDSDVTVAFMKDYFLNRIPDQNPAIESTDPTVRNAIRSWRLIRGFEIRFQLMSPYYLDEFYPESGEFLLDGAINTLSTLFGNHISNIVRERRQASRPEETSAE